jgi:hypothetical protein
MLNPDPPIFELACVDLQARIAQARRDTLDEISHQQNAVPLEDSLGYMEPPDWFYPNRENLGHDLRRVATAAEAELVFRQDQKKNPRNGRSLHGLKQALQLQGRNESLAFVEQERHNAWQYAYPKPP